MPSFDTSVDFEVYCNTCGNGMCGESEVVRTYRRGELAVRVNACPKCVERARDEGFESRNSEVESLTDRIAELESQLQEITANQQPPAYA